MKTTTTSLFLILAFFSGLHLAQAQPTITNQPASRINNIGDNAQFTVVAGGSGTLTYQWQLNGGNIAGGTTSVLNQLVTDTNQAGIYRVLVSDDSGLTNTSDNAVLSLPYGNRTRITQWDFNTPPLTGTATSPTSIGQGTVTNVGGVTTDGIVRTGSSSDPAASGNTARSLQKPAGSAANKSGGLQVNVSTVGYHNIVITFEQQVGARASAYWRVQYTADGVAWVDNAVVDLRTPYARLGAGSYTFYSANLSGIPSVEDNPNFAIRIVAEWESTATGLGANAYVSAQPGNTYNSSGGPVAQWDMMTILGTVGNTDTQPEIVTQPASQTRYIGDNVTFFVNVSGGNLEYQWRFHGTNLAGATADSLTLTNVQLSDAGNYSVAVTNSAGFAISDDAVLTVGPRPLDFYWSGDGITPGGPGQWNTTSANWSSYPTGPFNLVWSNGLASTATLPSHTSNTLQTITLAEPVVLNRITNNPTSNFGYLIAGTNLLTFAGTNPVVHRTRSNTQFANQLAFQCPVTGPVLTKTGDGRVAFTNNFDEIGNITVAPNTIQKYHVLEGLISASVVACFGEEPAELVPDFFKLENGNLGIDGYAALDSYPVLGAHRGITLIGNNDIGVASAAAILTINGPITGPGSLRFPNFTQFPGQVHGAHGTFVLSNTNNDYQGTTTMLVGELRLGNSEVLPNTTTLILSGNSGVSYQGRLNLNGFTETIGNVICSGAGAQIYDLSVIGSVTNRNTGMLIATNYDIQTTYTLGEALSAVLGGNANLTKTTAGTAGLRGANTYTGNTYFNEGAFELNGIGTFGNGQGTLFLIGTNSGGSTALDLAFSETRTEATTLMNPIVMTANEVTFRSASTATGNVQVIHGGTWSTGGGRLYLFRSHLDGLFELALTNSLTFSTPIDVGYQCQLTSFNPAGSEQTFSGGISDSGSFRRSVSSGAGGRTIFTTDNSYSGGTIIEAGTLLVNNTSGSGTGSGAVTVGAPGGVLGGSGIVGGPVTVSGGGSIAAGDSAGILTLQSGLDMSGGGTNIWELAALKDNSDGVAGTDFDQLVLTGGELQLGGSSSLLLQFAGGVTPNSAVSFWQSAHSWTIVSLSGGLNTANAAFASIVNGSYNAGNFATSVDGSGNIVLTFTPNAPAAPHVTTHPQSRTNVLGTTASFTVTATGTDPLTYAWFRSTAPFTPIAGATTATYTITNVQNSQAGDYFARVSNSLGNDTSQTATLTVAPRPQVQSPAVVDGNVVLNWPAVPGTAYQVQYNTNLATANWYMLTNVVAEGLSLSVTDHPPVGTPRRFYRLLVQ